VSTAIGAITEAAEVLSVLNTKARPWYDKGLDREDAVQVVAEEVTDVFTYTIELFELLGMNADDILFQYRRKNAINMARIVKSASSNIQARVADIIMNRIPNERDYAEWGFLECYKPTFALVSTGIVLLEEMDEFMNDPVHFVRSVIDERLKREV
jgi:hypothetical protein